METRRNKEMDWIVLLFFLACFVLLFLFIVEHSGTRSSEEVGRHSSHSFLTATPRPRIRNNPNVFGKFVIFFSFEREGGGERGLGEKEAGKQHLLLEEYQSINFAPFRFCSTFKRTFENGWRRFFRLFHSPCGLLFGWNFKTYTAEKWWQTQVWSNLSEFGSHLNAIREENRRGEKRRGNPIIN